MESDSFEFWLVWSPTGTSPPKHRHTSEELARKEAERLAEAAPSAEFYVLCAVSRSTTKRVMTTRLESIPF